MFWLGSGPIRGFAVTLTLGIMTSVFTAVTIARLLVVLVARRSEDAQGGGAARLQAAGLLEDGQRPLMKFLFKGFDFFPHDTRWRSSSGATSSSACPGRWPCWRPSC